MALPELAYLKFIDKKYDEAITLYKEFLNRESDDIPYQSLARIALATCYEEKGEFEKAIEILKNLADSPDDFLRGEAMLGLARVYGLAGKPEKASAVLKEFVDKFPTSPSLPIAKAHLNKLS